jgi:hypothetical protein
LLASQQPKQVLMGQVPPQPSAAPLHLAAQSGTHLHVPATQVGVDDGQLTQVPPLAPQALAVVPGWQAPLESQQPPQVLVGQVPPQPSSTPWHLAAQSGTHLHVPETQVGVDTGQLTQVSPLVPQALLAVPGWQTSPTSQQPVQVLVGQGSPHPSSSPLQRPVQ